MKRVMGCNFRTALFTNLTQDRMDYHGIIEQYRNIRAFIL
ncbi:Mur ligase family protein [Peribacillus butanolivorans]